MQLTVDGVTVWLAEYLGRDPSGVARVGAGSWSTGFAFDVADESFIVRFGVYVDDFDKDRLAATYGCDRLPIPHVHSIGARFPVGR